MTLLLAALAFTFPLVACSSDDSDGGTDVGSSDVVVTGGISSSWDGLGLWAEDVSVEESVGFVLAAFEGNDAALADEVVVFGREGGKPGEGDYVLGDGTALDQFVGLYAYGLTGTTPGFCISIPGGDLTITSSNGTVDADFDFDAACFLSETGVNVSGSISAEEADDIDVPLP